MKTSTQVLLVVCLAAVGIGVPLYREFGGAALMSALTNGDSNVLRKGTKDFLSFSAIDIVKSGVLEDHPSVKIGDALSVAFRDSAWTEFTTPSGARTVRFEGGLSPDTAYEIRQAVLDLENPATRAMVGDLRLQPIADLFQPGVVFRYEFVFDQRGEQFRMGSPDIAEKGVRGLKLPDDFYDGVIFR